MARSCNDCHSLQTRWPWYSRVPIVSGILREDVKRGRADMNFSDWSAQVELGWDGERGTLNGICEELQSANMPVHSYLLMHPRCPFVAGGHPESVQLDLPGHFRKVSIPQMTRRADS